jgi:hypothetical protein
VAVTHFAVFVHIVRFLVIVKGFSNKTQTAVGRITQRSTGRQKQPRFYQLANYWLNNVIVSKVIPFLLFRL